MLGLRRVSVDGNFFALGGDSIMSIQLVSRARAAGLVITPRLVFQHQTVEALAACALPLEPTPSAPEAETGPVPLTPVMLGLLQRGGLLDRSNYQAMLLQTPAGLALCQLQEVLQAVLDRHDALRLRAIPPAESGWDLEIMPQSTITAEACLHRVEGNASEAAIHTHRAAAERRLDPVAGHMLQAVWFDAGTERPGRLLLAIHHLATDGVSWRILLPDLAAAWTAIAAGRPAHLPRSGTSFRRWAQLLAEEAPTRATQLPFWTATLAPPSLRLTDAPLDPARDRHGTARHLRLTLRPSVTAPLLTHVPAAFHARINDVLLTALGLAVAAWRRKSEPVLVDLESHGREEIAPRHRPVAHARLVHHAVSGAARPRRARPGRGAGGRAGAGAGTQAGQGTAPRRAGKRARLRAAALAQQGHRRRPRAAGAAAARLQLSRPLRRVRRPRTGAAPAPRSCWATPIPPCRSRTPSKSMR